MKQGEKPVKERRKRKEKRTKDRILNARIPAELDEMLRERADNLDMPVSQLVRNILHCTVDLVGSLSGNVENMVADIVEDVSVFKQRAREAMGVEELNPIEELVSKVIGWQEIRVNQSGRCAVSGEPLEVGSLAHLGIRNDGEPAIVISDATLTAILAKRTAEAAWLEIKLNQDAICADTGATLAAGARAFFRQHGETVEVISVEAHNNRTGISGPASQAVATLVGAKGEHKQ